MGAPRTFDLYKRRGAIKPSGQKKSRKAIVCSAGVKKRHDKMAVTGCRYGGEGLRITNRIRYAMITNPCRSCLVRSIDTHRLRRPLTGRAQYISPGYTEVKGVAFITSRRQFLLAFQTRCPPQLAGHSVYRFSSTPAQGNEYLCRHSP